VWGASGVGGDRIGRDAEMERVETRPWVAVAEQLPEELGAALLGAAREAFTQGLRLTAAISAGIVLGIAALAATLLRDVRGGSEAEERLETEPA
jgi:MFS transporter, DHA2 family, multidrug resistance protein